MTLPYSRPAAVAARLLKNPRAGQLLLKPVLLTGDAAALATPGGRSMFLAALSLLTRFCAVVHVHIGAGAFKERAMDLAAQIHHAGAITFLLPEEVKWLRYGAILNVGKTQRPDLPWTSIASDGWAIQVCSGAGRIELSFKRFNPAATLAAASLGASEVFKRLLGIVPPLGALLENEVFSLLSYTANADPGPEIGMPLRLDCILAGHGAIGNGVRHVLLQLPLQGWLAIIDNQKADEENWGTYIDLLPSQFGIPKAELATMGWGSSVMPVHYNIDIAAARPLLGTKIPYADLTLSALDNIDARHELQLFWPDVAIDGAISDITCQVSRHPWGPDTACLQCLFRPPEGEDAATVASRATGLSVQSVSRQEEVVTQGDIDAAPTEKRAWLAARKGQLKCSVIREALAAQLTEGASSFSPSAPFVATFSGAMVAAEFIKVRSGLESALDPRFQFNMLVGPVRGTHLAQGRRRACFCVQRQRAVERWREAMKSLVLSAPVLFDR